MAQAAHKDPSERHGAGAVFGDSLLLDRYPETEDEANLVEETLGNAMAKLSVDEEDRLLFDMYGFPSGLDEEPSTSSTIDGLQNIGNINDSPKSNEQIGKLNRLQDALTSQLRSVPESVRKTYERTIEMNPSFLRQQGLLFVAAVKEGEKDNFAEAAKLLLDHLEVKREIFPENVLARHVLWTDLAERDQDAVSHGCYQFSKALDLLGRKVFHVSSHRVIELVDKGKNEDLWLVLSRAMWYTMMCCLQSDPSVLESGFVFAICSVASRSVPFEINKACLRVFWRLPFKFQWGHIFHTSPTLHICYKALLLVNIFFKGSKCVRLSVHWMTSIAEIKDKMMSVGLDPAASPWAACNNDAQGWSPQNQLEWIERQKNREHLEMLAAQGNSPSLSRVTPEIQPFDVLLGRSKQCSEHMGTKRCKALVALHQKVYEATNVKGKTKIANEIVDAIGQSGGRFLRYENEQWTEVSLTIARQKVAHYFRFLRSKGREN